MKCIVRFDLRILTSSPYLRGIRSWPSSVRPRSSASPPRRSVSMKIVICLLSGSTIGRIESDAGHIGLTVRLGTCGWTIGPPADNE